MTLNDDTIVDFLEYHFHHCSIRLNKYSYGQMDVHFLKVTSNNKFSIVLCLSSYRASLSISLSEVGLTTREEIGIEARER